MHLIRWFDERINTHRARFSLIDPTTSDHESDLVDMINDGFSFPESTGRKKDGAIISYPFLARVENSHYTSRPDNFKKSSRNTPLDREALIEQLEILGKEVREAKFYTGERLAWMSDIDNYCNTSRKHIESRNEEIRSNHDRMNTLKESLEKRMKEMGTIHRMAARCFDKNALNIKSELSELRKKNEILLSSIQRSMNQIRHANDIRNALETDIRHLEVVEAAVTESLKEARNPNLLYSSTRLQDIVVRNGDFASLVQEAATPAYA